MKWLSLIWLFTRELMASALRVALLTVKPNLQLRPAIVAFPLDVKSDAEITLLANMITLTPGTLSVDISDDRSTLFIHVLDLRDRNELVADLRRGFEYKVKEVLGV